MPRRSSTEHFFWRSSAIRRGFPPDSARIRAEFRRTVGLRRGVRADPRRNGGSSAADYSASGSNPLADKSAGSADNSAADLTPLGSARVRQRLRLGPPTTPPMGGLRSESAADLRQLDVVPIIGIISGGVDSAADQFFKNFNESHASISKEFL